MPWPRPIGLTPSSRRIRKRPPASLSRFTPTANNTIREPIVPKRRPSLRFNPGRRSRRLTFDCGRLRQQSKVNRRDLLPGLNRNEGRRFGTIGSRIVLFAVGVKRLRLAGGRFRMRLDDGVSPMGRGHGIPAWSKPTQSVVSGGVRHRVLPRKEPALLTLETRGTRHYLNAGQRVAALIQHNARDGIDQLQTENEVVPNLAGCELDDRRRATKSVSAVGRSLITVLHGPQLIPAGRKIAEGKAAIRVRPGNRILRLRLHGGKRDDGAANRRVAAGVDDDSGDGAR